MKHFLLSIALLFSIACNAYDCEEQFSKVLKVGDITLIFQGSQCDFEEFEESGYDESTLHKSYIKYIDGKIVTYKHVSYK